MTTLAKQQARTEKCQQKTEKLIRKHKLWRVLELIPGLVSWGALLMPLILSFVLPDFVAVFIILFTVLWLFRSVKLSINLYRAYRVSRKALKVDWDEMISYNDRPEKIDYQLKKINKQSNPKKYFELKHLKSTLKKLQRIGQYKKSKEIYHAILYVTYKESYELIRESIKSYVDSTFPSNKMIFVFAGEESDKENFLKITDRIKKEFGAHFGHFLVTIHPKGLPGEIKGKSANATWAGKKLRQFLDREKIKYDNVILNNFDADSVTHPLYFSELTFKYLTNEDRTKKAYQPLHLFHNNIWDVPVMIRMVAQSCSFWRMAESMESHKYKSFSSRSLSFQTCVDVDYWDPSIIPEDSRQYWTAFAIYDGEHTLVPIHCPLYMDAVLSETYVKTFKSQYTQLRRWAWGVCDFPFMFLNLWYHPKISLRTKILQVYRFLESSLFWATGPFLITFMGFVPGWINPAFRETVLAYNVPRVMSDILTFSSLGILMCAIISIAIIPVDARRRFFSRLGLVLQWLLIPVVSIFLSAVPALDAQTRLMLGQHLEYKVTEKARK